MLTQVKHNAVVGSNTQVDSLVRELAGPSEVPDPLVPDSYEELEPDEPPARHSLDDSGMSDPEVPSDSD